jgi:hypothetical protein
MSRDDRPYNLTQVPSVKQYKQGLEAIRAKMSDLQLQSLLKLFEKQYSAPNQTVTATKLAEFIEKSVIVVNNCYGKSGARFCDEIGFNLSQYFNENMRSDFKVLPKGWPIWSIGYEIGTIFYWEMRKEVAEALEQLSWLT